MQLYVTLNTLLETVNGVNIVAKSIHKEILNEIEEK